MPEEIDHIAELQKRLYARDPESVPKRKYGILRPLRDNVTSAWGDADLSDEKYKRTPSSAGYKRFFIFSLLFFLIGLGIALFSIYRGAITLSSRNVDVSVLGNSFVGGGETLPLQVEVANHNAGNLEQATLSLDYPKGAIEQTPTAQDTVHVVNDLGTVSSGKTKSSSFSVVLYGQAGTTRTITATLDYHLAGSNATFEKKATFVVTINSSPVALTVNAPAAIGTNQPFTITIHNAFSGEQTLPNMITRVEYPNGFLFDSSTPTPISGNNVWALGGAQAGTTRDIVIHGKLVGEEGEQKAFRIYTGTPVSDSDYHVAVAFNSALQTLSIKAPFITGQIVLNTTGSDTVAVPIGSTVSGVVSWKNNSAFTITAPTFTLALTGDNIDTSSIVADKAYYNAINNTITWTPDSDSDIATIPSGASGTLPFSFGVKDTTLASDVDLALSVSGTIPDQNNAAESIANVDEKTVKYASRLQFAATPLYSVGPIKNSGPFPSRVNQTTTYSVTWTARPAENALTSMTATAVLPPGVTWTGTIIPSTAMLSYNADTRTVTWNVGTMPKATAIPASKSVSFQLSIRPTKEQTGAEVSLLGTTTVSATDSVAGTPLSVTRPALSTRLDADPTYSPGKEKVLP